jgi:hypothetical protein
MEYNKGKRRKGDEEKTKKRTNECRVDATVTAPVGTAV